MKSIYLVSRRSCRRFLVGLSPYPPQNRQILLSSAWEGPRKRYDSPTLTEEWLYKRYISNRKNMKYDIAFSLVGFYSLSWIWSCLIDFYRLTITEHNNNVTNDLHICLNLYQIDLIRWNILSLLSKFSTDPQADFATGFRRCLLGMVNAASAQSMLWHISPCFYHKVGFNRIYMGFLEFDVESVERIQWNSNDHPFMRCSRWQQRSWKLRRSTMGVQWFSFNMFQLYRKLHPQKMLDDSWID